MVVAALQPWAEIGARLWRIDSKFQSDALFLTAFRLLDGIGPK